MQRSALFGLLAKAAVALACDIPSDTLSNTITEPFGVLIQNPAFPIVHDRYLNLNAAGGGDQHPYLSPAGVSAFDFVLNDGVIFQPSTGIRVVISIQSTANDNTTKIFLTDRNNVRALFQPVYACNPDDDSLQTRLAFLGGQGITPGGKVCVRSASGNRYEFRYSPPGNPVVDPSKPCIEVTLVLAKPGGGGVTSVPTTSHTSTSTSSSTSTSHTSTSTTSQSSTSTSTSTTTPGSTSSTTTSTSTAPTSTGTSGPLPYTDLAASKGFAFVGCSPEARRADDGLGRTLTGASLAQDGMTNEVCLDFCRAKGYAYAGTEYRRECYCGNSVAPTRQPKTTLVSLKDCSLTCLGNTAQYCGGQSWLSLYRLCPAGGPCENAVFT